MNNSNHTSVKHLVDEATGSFGTPERAESATQRLPKAEIHEMVEHEPDTEVSQFIEVKKDKIDLPQELIDAGVESTGEIKYPSTKPISLPLSDDKIESGQHAPITTSIKWLSELCIYILKQAHLGLKKIHGKVVRVAVK